MSSSLSELRNFRLNKKKLATGRKRIRAMSDSSDDEHIKKQPNIESTPSIHSQPQSQQQNQQEPQPIENGQASEIKLTVKEKEERFHLLSAAVGRKIDSLVLQDFLVHNEWNVQKAYEAVENSPKFKSILENSPSKPTTQLNDFSPSKSSSLNKSPQLIKAQKKHKVREKNIVFVFYSNLKC